MQTFLSLLLVNAFLLLAAPGPAKATPMVLDAVQDANVYKANPDTNCHDTGNSADVEHLIARRRPIPGPWNFDDVTIGFVQFDLSPIPSGAQVASMALDLTYRISNYTAPFHINIYRVEGDDWDEKEITWNNMPYFDFAPEGSDTDAIASLWLDPPETTGEIFQVNLLALNLYDPAGDLADNKLTLALNNPSPPGGVGFFSMEGSGPQNPAPRLKVSLVPEPTGLALLSCGLLASITSGIKKRFF